MEINYQVCSPNKFWAILLAMITFLLDVDECEGENPCDPGECKNTNGFYICECPAGYYFRQGKCKGMWNIRYIVT